jgi:hypothetical protein
MVRAVEATIERVLDAAPMLSGASRFYNCRKAPVRLTNGLRMCPSDIKPLIALAVLLHVAWLLRSSFLLTLRRFGGGFIRYQTCGEAMAKLFMRARAGNAYYRSRGGRDRVRRHHPARGRQRIRSAAEHFDWKVNASPGAAGHSAPSSQPTTTPKSSVEIRFLTVAGQ